MLPFLYKVQKQTIQLCIVRDENSAVFGKDGGSSNWQRMGWGFLIASNFLFLKMNSAGIGFPPNY